MDTTSNESTAAMMQEDIHCPLCDYNLRGLTEARCPECGGRFDWEELRDPNRRVHPYLFEHHPERNIWSFCKTATGGIRPRRFWVMLNPVQPSRPRRLLVYFFICAFIASLSAIVDYANDCELQYTRTLTARAQMQAQMNPSNTRGGYYFYNTNSIIQQYGSVQKYIDTVEPLPPSIEFFSRAAGLRSYHSSNSWRMMGSGEEMSLPRNIPYLMLAWVWPMTAALTLMMLRATMRRAKVRAAHLFRVTIYCADVMIWLGLFQLVIAIIHLAMGRNAINAFTLGTPAPQWMELLIALGGIGSLIAAVIMMYRLAIAINQYLRFRHAAATAVAVQIIFGLVVFKVMLVFAGY